MSNISIPVGITFAPGVFTPSNPSPGDIAVSTGQAIAGIGTTAMGALVLTQMGQSAPLVLTPIVKSPYR